VCGCVHLFGMSLFLCDCVGGRIATKGTFMKARNAQALLTPRRGDSWSPPALSALTPGAAPPAATPTVTPEAAPPAATPTVTHARRHSYPTLLPAHMTYSSMLKTSTAKLGAAALTGVNSTCVAATGGPSDCSVLRTKTSAERVFCSLKMKCIVEKLSLLHKFVIVQNSAK